MIHRNLLLACEEEEKMDGIKADIDKLVKHEEIIKTVDKVQHSYLIDAGIMPLIRAVPLIGDMISTSTDKAIKDFQEKKQQELIECIINTPNIVTTEKVNNVEFIINFSKTVEAVKRLATNDKVVYFGNLLRNGYFESKIIDNNDFEEFSNIINDLSYREIVYLTFFIERHKKLKWNQFTKEFNIAFGIKPSETYHIFTRLKRTGFLDELFETESTNVEDNEVSEMEVSGSGFELTPLIKCFSKYVLNIDVDNIAANK